MNVTEMMIYISIERMFREQLTNLSGKQNKERKGILSATSVRLLQEPNFCDQSEC
jgi:hypothetical protein